MTYIINPMWFYWLNIVNGLKMVASAALLASLAGLFFVRMASDLDDTADNQSDCKRWGKRFGIVLFISLIALILIPSKETMVQMMAARLATYENAELAVEGIKSAVDYVIEAVGKMSGK